jgi:histidinol phosphatase-like enzyme (inositol monophosphatase family)
MSTESLHNLLDFAQELAWQAGKITLAYFGTGVLPDFKADQTPVTIADRESEQRMRSMIEARFPAHAILGEEYGETNAGASYRWILDPIDGTKSFVQGVPLYGVLVGLEREGEPVVGVCYLPALNEMVAAAQGMGCTLNGRRVHVSNVSRLEDAVLLSSDAESFAEHGRDAVYNQLRANAKFTRTWGDCYGHVLVATGRAEIMLDPVMNVWDCAALLPIMHEAGGTFTDWNGQPTIWGGNAISTNGVLRDEVIKTLECSNTGTLNL